MTGLLTAWNRVRLEKLNKTHSASQEILSLLWNPKVHYRVQNSPPLVSILGQKNSIKTLPLSLRFILILSFHPPRKCQIL